MTATGARCDGVLAADLSTASVTANMDGVLHLLTVATGDFDSPGLRISGNWAVLRAFLGELDEPDQAFNIVTP